MNTKKVFTFEKKRGRGIKKQETTKYMPFETGTACIFSLC